MSGNLVDLKYMIKQKATQNIGLKVKDKVLTNSVKNQKSYIILIFQEICTLHLIYVCIITLIMIIVDF